MANGGRDRNERFVKILSELGRRQKIEACEGSLIEFIRQHWHILEPETPLVEGWALDAMCEHLEAVTRGEITRLLINIPPGSMKSLCCNVFWPAWQWGPKNLAHQRYVTFSYAAHLTERDNLRFRNLVGSPEYRDKFGDRFKLQKVGEFLVSNSKMGWKLASSIGGISTGERGDGVILDDPHNVKQGESKIIRTMTVDWFSNAMSNRLNDLLKSWILVVMQRVHEDDVAGRILTSDLGYEKLIIPAEYEEGRHCHTSIGWTDPRTEEKQNFWEARFPEAALQRIKNTMSPSDYASQYQQRPVPKGGAIFNRDWWEHRPIRINKDGSHRFLPSGVGFDYIVASLDTAYTTKEQNDYSALTVWGTFRNQYGEPKVMLIDAWRKRLSLHGMGGDEAEREIIRFDDKYYLSRAERQSTKGGVSPEWGLAEWVAYTCRLRRVDRLLIESKSAGQSVAQELHRLYGREIFGIDLITPRGDKVARANSVIPLFSGGVICIPCEQDGEYLIPLDYAEDLMTEAEYFPRGSHDDMVDSMVQALKHMRDVGLALRREEYKHEAAEAMKYKPPLKPLYPC